MVFIPLDLTGGTEQVEDISCSNMERRKRLYLLNHVIPAPIADEIFTEGMRYMKNAIIVPNNRVKPVRHGPFCLSDDAIWIKKRWGV